MPDKTVFVVDDDAAVTQGLRFMLRTGGYSVDAFPSARSFLEGYDPRRGGCLLLDIRMPRMTGPELQQQLNVRGWRIPVIFITGHGSVSLAIAAMQAGAFDFIEKPLREDALIESIERALRWNDRAYEERLERATVQARVAALTHRANERSSSWRPRASPTRSSSADSALASVRSSCISPISSRSCKREAWRT
jgi:two-component system, LuxR family, response regulator FixJ